MTLHWIDETMNQNSVPHIYKRRRTDTGILAIGEQRRTRFLARFGAVMFLGLTIAHGLVQGGHLNYEGSVWMKLPGKLSGLVGLAADDIQIAGLVHQEPDVVLSAIGVRPGASLIGFDANIARNTLAKLDWVAEAKVQRLFPNQLQISLVERVPFAVWQRSGLYYVIDKSGANIGGMDPSQLSALPLITGEGADIAAGELVNHLEAYPELVLKLKAAARVGKRRWTLYLDNGVKIALPETNFGEAIERVVALDKQQQILSKGVEMLDLRQAGQMTVTIAEVKSDEAETKKPVKLSQVQ